jgi:hypothetical protein
MYNPCKDFLVYENQRNKKNAVKLKEVITKVFGEQESVVIAHHICYGSIEDSTEIPAIDTLYFDHDVMGQLFGENSLMVMVKLAKTAVPDRDDVFKNFFDTVAV